MIDLNAFPEFPTCMLCHDAGIVDHTGRFEFCGCPAGYARAESEPSACDEANHVQERLARL